MSLHAFSSKSCSQVVLSPVMTVIILLMYVSTPILLRDNALRTAFSSRKSNKKWERDFSISIEYDDNYQGAFCKACRKSVPTQTQTSQGSQEAEFIDSTGGTVIHHFQHIGNSDKSKNRNAIKSFLWYTHFLCKQHIPHTTNFNWLFNLVVACGGKLKVLVNLFKGSKECILHLNICSYRFC